MILKLFICLSFINYFYAYPEYLGLLLERWSMGFQVLPFIHSGVVLYWAVRQAGRTGILLNWTNYLFISEYLGQFECRVQPGLNYITVFNHRKKSRWRVLIRRINTCPSAANMNLFEGLTQIQIWRHFSCLVIECRPFAVSYTASCDILSFCITQLKKS